VRFVAKEDAQPAPTPSVDQVVAIAQFVRAQIAAEEAARRGEYAQARQVMVLFQEAVSARGHERSRVRRGIAADRRRVPRERVPRVRKGGSRNVTTLYQDEALEDLRSMGQGKTTAAQDRMADSFGASRESRQSAAETSSRGLSRKRSKRW
jgi:hypothetical protein